MKGRYILTLTTIAALLFGRVATSRAEEKTPKLSQLITESSVSNAVQRAIRLSATWLSYSKPVQIYSKSRGNGKRFITFEVDLQTDSSNQPTKKLLEYEVLPNGQLKLIYKRGDLATAPRNTKTNLAFASATAVAHIQAEGNLEGDFEVAARPISKGIFVRIVRFPLMPGGHVGVILSPNHKIQRIIRGR